MVTEESIQELERRVGRPRDKWEALKARVQDQAIKRFDSIEQDWLDLMWTLDAYRIVQVPPADLQPAEFDGLYRGKGNWFAELLALILHNRTYVNIKARARVQGFSQLHQIDIAWPPRDKDPLVCCATKVMGAPAFGDKKARKAMADFTNRRKELKFAATDLKLYRRNETNHLQHWDVWRENQTPKTFFVWGARIEPPEERIETLIREARILIDTYLDGAGLFAWKPSVSGGGYVVVPLPSGERVTTLDDMLHRIENEINDHVDQDGNPPLPVEPEQPRTPSDQSPENI